MDHANNKGEVFVFLRLNLIALILSIATHGCIAASSSKTHKPISEFAENLHGFLQLGTDHVWRGISFSNHLPEIYGSMLYMPTQGVYGGVIAYDTMLTNGGIGFAPIVGIKGELHRLSYDLSARYESYPQYVTLVTPSMGEFYGELGYSVSPSLKVLGGLGYSPNYYFESGNGIYSNAMIVISLPYQLSIDGGIGYQTTKKGGSPGNLWFKDYLNWTANIAKDLKKDFKIGFRFTQTNLSKTECYGANICSPAYNAYIRKTF